MLKQEDIIRFYEGDVKEKNGPFYSDTKAYVTWNSLLFPTIETEIARSKENRILNSSFVDHIDEIIDMSFELYKTMQPSKEDKVVYRVERLSDYSLFLSEGRFTSFVSTSTSGFLNAYQDKEGLVLLKIIIPKGNRCVDFSEVLDDYKKAEEKEILLPPYSSFQYTNLEMNEEIKNIKDRNSHSPVVYAEIVIGKQKYDHFECNDPFSMENIESSKKFYDCLNHKEQFDLEDASKYMILKTGIQNEIKRRMEEYDNH